MRILILFGVFFLLQNVMTDDEVEQSVEKKTRGKKGLAIFNLVKFPNDPCAASSNNRNGTCFTSEECSSKGGTSMGSCADGYGVCCVFLLTCGQTVSENNSYLYQASSTTFSNNPCTYQICRCDTNVCRIRLDFISFNIEGPFTGQTLETTLAANDLSGPQIGDCAGDSFTVTSPGGAGTPVICGLNSGQHIYLDATSACSLASFGLSSTSTAREWNIRVTQFNCGNLMGGPKDCLQYFTSDTGTFASFNFPAGQVGDTATHLSNQCYSICFRRNAGKCSICFVPSRFGPATTPTNQNSFGLSISSNAAAKAGVDAMCSTDYIIIEGAAPAANAAGAMNVEQPGISRICGRAFAVAAATAAGTDAAPNESVCTGRSPFKITFKSDEGEATATTAAIGDELAKAPSGTIGFSLNFVQQNC